MAWYRSGTIAVTNGSPIVTGTGTTFVANVQTGHAINLPDGRVYEVAAVNSDTQITLGSAYMGATAAGQAYSIQPNQGFAQQAASALAAFLSQYSGYLSTALAGRFGDGSAAAPGITFAGDQDTGIYRPGDNQLALVTAAVTRLLLDSAGRVAIGGNPLTTQLGVQAAAPPRGVVATFQATGSVGAQITFYQDGIGFSSIGMPATTGGLAFYLNRYSGGDGSEVARFDPSGNLGVGTTNPAAKLHVNSFTGNNTFSVTGNNNGGAGYGVLANGLPFFGSYFSTAMLFGTNIGGAMSEFARFDQTGNLLVGVTSGASHRIAKIGAQGTLVATIDNGSYASAAFYTVSSAGTGSTTNAAVKLGFDTGTNRSMNAGGTINANGADYAEYMTKAAGCGMIAKGAVCGVDADGRLVTDWSAAHSFVVKSTNPNLVGGDTWSAHLGDRPSAPVLTLPPYDGVDQPVAPTAPIEPMAIEAVPIEPVREDGEDDDAYAHRKALYLIASAAWIKTAADYRVAMAAFASAEAKYEADLASYRTDLAAYETATAAHAAAVAQSQADHEAAQARYLTDLTAFEEALETARLTVDRIAFCGQVPVNVTGEFAVGDYIVAAQDGDGIKAVAVPAAAIAFEQYCGRIGKVWGIRDGSAWIDVQHG